MGSGAKGSKWGLPGELSLLWRLGASPKRMPEEGRRHEGQRQRARLPAVPRMGKSKPNQREGQRHQGFLKPRHRSMGQGEKGAYGGKGTCGLYDDWTESYYGYSFSYEDTTLLSLGQEAMSEWQTPSPKKTCKLSLVSVHGACGRACKGGHTRHFGQWQLCRSGKGSGSLRPRPPHDDVPG